MATWIGHLRVAENLLERGYNLDREAFAIGNLAPDSGIRNEQGEFEPASSVTHFGKEGDKVGAENFYQQYLADSDALKTMDQARRSLLIGYYVHLLCDELWTDMIWKPFKDQPAWIEGSANDPEYIWVVKKDWYGHDFVYLDQHPESLFYTTLAQIKHVPDYLPFIPVGYLTKTAERITGYYTSDENMQLSLAHDYPFMARQVMDDYVRDASDVIAERLEGLGLV